MTDLTPTLNTLLVQNNTPIGARTPTETADEFLKEAYRINTHITSLLNYLHQIRQPYLTPAPSTRRRKHSTHGQTSHNHSQNHAQSHSCNHGQTLTDTDRDEIDTSTTHLLHTLSTSIANLSSAESLRQETVSSVLRKKYGRGVAGGLLFRWAGGSAFSDGGLGLGGGGGGGGSGGEGKSSNQLRDEETARVTGSVRESILWFLRTGLEAAVRRQRELVERRIERVRERERSVLYKSPVSVGVDMDMGRRLSGEEAGSAGTGGGRGDNAAITESERQEIESQLSAEQLQLFAEENSSMLRYYEDTLGKVQNAEKSLLEISSLQQSLVSHLSTQEDYIGQLVGDAATTQTNVGGGNRELRRAQEKRSSAVVVFWATVGLCVWLVVWDLVF